MTREREPGELTGVLDRQLHAWLLEKSALYRFFYEEGLVGRMIVMQRDHLDEFLAHVAGVRP